MWSVNGQDSVARSNALLKLGAELHAGGGLTDGRRAFDTLRVDKCGYKEGEILSSVFHMPSVADAPSSPSQTEWHPLLAASLLLSLDATKCRTVHPTWRYRISRTKNQKNNRITA